MNNIKDFKNFKFFVKPCSICKNLTWESGNDGYSTYCKAECKEIDIGMSKDMQWVNNFPYVESPKKCTKNNLFIFNENYDSKMEDDYYRILRITQNYLGVSFIDDFLSPKRILASKIAYSLSDFEQRIRNLRVKSTNE